MSEPRRYLGIDPGLAAMGWGVIECVGSRLSHIANGTLVTDARMPLGERLVVIERGLLSVIEIYAPHAAAVETAFVARDAQAALKLGQSRGIALLVPARAGLPIAEYAPNHIKKSVVGVGHADKGQIRMMVEMLLPGCKAGSEHAADALAIAICHAQEGGGEERIAAALLREAASR
jgi:crossover junction endodeoxyribonuclease RuvC